MNCNLPTYTLSCSALSWITTGWNRFLKENVLARTNKITLSVWMYFSLISLQQKWKRVQPVGQATTRHSGICEWRGLAEFSASDRSAQEFTGDSCLTVEMPRNNLPHPLTQRTLSEQPLRSRAHPLPFLITFDSHRRVNFTGFVVVSAMGICMVVKKGGIFRMREEKGIQALSGWSCGKNKISGQDCEPAGRDLIRCLWNRWVTCLEL